MPPKDNSERACEECIHFFACSRQCGKPMAQSSATGCECYETVKSSMAYYVGTLDRAKGKIPNRLRELAEADKEGRVVILPCEATPDWQLVREQRRVEFWKRQYEGCIHLKARVGDTLWLTASYYTERLPQPMEARVVRIKIDAGDEITYATTRRRVSGKEIGKTVFLTREEAERALEARNGDQ